MVSVEWTPLQKLSSRFAMSGRHMLNIDRQGGRDSRRQGGGTGSTLMVNNGHTLATSLDFKASGRDLQGGPVSGPRCQGCDNGCHTFTQRKTAFNAGDLSKGRLKRLPPFPLGLNLSPVTSAHLRPLTPLILRPSPHFWGSAPFLARGVDG